MRNLKQALLSEARVTNIMACGTGKTLVGAEMARLVSPAEPVLIVVPTLDLVAQTLTAWAEGVGREQLGRIIAVCSDREVMDRDDADDLDRLHVEVTSDPLRLSELLRGQSGRATVAITYQSLPKLVEDHPLHGARPWKLAIIDEAHRSAGLKGRKWSMIHDDGLVPADRRMYMTATPRLVSVRDDSRAGEVISMDNQEIFGRVGHRLSFAEARRRRLLADYRVVVCVMTDEEMHRLATDPNGSPYLQVGASAVSADVLARQVAVLRSAREFDVRRMLSYHHRIADARWFSQTLPAVDALLGSPGNLTTGFVTGSQSRAERRRELDKLSDPGLERVVIANARVLTEGYNAPAVGAIAFIDAKKSTIDTVQAVGRALRLGGDPNKTAYIFVPVLLAQGQDPVDALEDSVYGPVWRVVNALAAHDETLGQELDARRRELGRKSRASGNSVTELPDWLRISGVPVPERFARAITVHTVRSTTSSWEEKVGAAAAYAAEHGNLLPHVHFVTEAGVRLGEWLHNARQLYRRGKLSPSRVRQLEELGMVWDVRDEEFNRRIAAAAAYHSEHGHLRIPKGYTTPGPDPLRLGGWINGVRSRRESLSPRQREALNKLNMVWGVFDEDWKEGIDAASSYRARHGHLRVPGAHVEKSETPNGVKGFPLGSWLIDKRGKHKSLTAKRLAELDALGMVWDQEEDVWQQWFRAAQAYHARQGNLDMPRQHIEQLPDGPVPLGAWLARQHDAIEAGRLSAERGAVLEKLGMKPIKAHERAWQNGLACARLYYQKFQTLDIPKGLIFDTPEGEEFKLGSWLGNVRLSRSQGTLTKARIAQLDELGMIWNVPEYRWQQYLTAAEAFYQAEGHLEVPPKYVSTGPHRCRLGDWIARQRDDFKKNELSEQRIRDLARLNMRW